MSKHKKKDKVEESAKGKEKKIVKKKAVAKTLEAPSASVVEAAPATTPIEPSVAPKKTAPKAPATKSPAKTAVKAGKVPVEVGFSDADIGLRAYYIAEHRHRHHIHGDEAGDWIEAERQLRAEAAGKKKK